MLQLRKALPSLKQLGCARHLTQGTGALAGTPTPKEDADDADAYQLLPPGCSMIDPTYGLNESDDDKRVVFYDGAHPAESPVDLKRADKPVPPTPASRAAAQQQLDDKQSAEEDEPYVYLPPGSSMREPGYSSVSDPMEVRKVYRRDPVPADAKE